MRKVNTLLELSGEKRKSPWTVHNDIKYLDDDKNKILGILVDVVIYMSSNDMDQKLLVDDILHRLNDVFDETRMTLRKDVLIDLSPMEITSVCAEKSNICNLCDAIMILDDGKLDMTCPECGYIKENLDMHCESIKDRYKTGTFKPKNHHKVWMNHILGIEPESEVKNLPKVLDDMRAIIRRDNRILRLLTVDNVRSMLKELKRTELNKNTTLLLKKLTGISPPHISKEYLRESEICFMKVSEVRDNLPSKKSNRKYYPYYIYKIFDCILPRSDRESRRILFYIHLQGRNTLINNDAEWREICKRLSMKKLKYRPTDVNEFGVEFFIDALSN
jgi:hypothetical protein